MSALGQERTLRQARSMSAIPPKADIRQYECDVRLVSKADIRRGSSFSGFDSSTRVSSWLQMKTPALIRRGLLSGRMS